MKKMKTNTDLMEVVVVDDDILETVHAEFELRKNDSYSVKKNVRLSDINKLVSSSKRDLFKQESLKVSKYDANKASTIIQETLKSSTAEAPREV